MLRQGDTGDWIGTFEGHKGAVLAATLNREATRAATGAADFSAKVWNALTGDEVQSFTHKHIVKCVDFSADSSALLTGGNEKLPRVFDLNKPDIEADQYPGHTGALRSCLWMKDMRQFITASDDKTIRLWDRASKKEVRQFELGAPVVDAELSRDGAVLLAVCANTVTFWDTATWEKLREFQLTSQINSASLHPERRSFVCGGEDFKMYKFDYSTGLELESFKGHFGPVHCVRYSPDGELYASGSEDGTLRLWQTTVGKTYGLWKCVIPADDPPLSVSNSNGDVRAEP